MTARQVLMFLQWMEDSGIDLDIIDFRVQSVGTEETAPLLGEVNVTIVDDPPGGSFAFLVP